MCNIISNEVNKVIIVILMILILMKCNVLMY